MITPHRAIFRDKAFKHYTEGRKKDVLPNFSSTPVAIFTCVLLILLIATGLVGWYTQVPIYLTAPGVILNAGQQAGGGSNEPIALTFFPASAASQIHTGESVQIQLGSGSPLTNTISEVLPGRSNPGTILAQYGIKSNSSQPSSQTMVVAIIKLGASFPIALYEGSSLAIETNIGSQSLFAAMASL